MNGEAPTKATRWPLVRVQPGHDCQVELLSGDWVRLSTHYYRRTFLCSEDEGCSCCELLPSRPYWYLPALMMPMRRVCLIEFSAAASADLEQHAKLLSGKIGAGLLVRLWRKSAKAPVKSEVIASGSASSRVALHDWLTALMAIFGLPNVRVDESIDAYGERVRETLNKRSELVATQMRLAQPKGVRGR